MARRPMLSAVAALLLVGQSVGLASVHQEKLLKATLVNGRFELSPPVPIDWQKLAPARLIEFDIEKAEPDFLSGLRTLKDAFNNAEIDFDLSLTSVLEESIFYLISEQGVQQIYAERLRGTVRYRLDEEGAITDRKVFGSLIATTREGEVSPQAGLVIVFDRPRSFETKESNFDDLELIPADVRKQWDLLPPKAHRFWSVRQQYRLKFEGQDSTYTFVKWASDDDCYEACCQLRYSVFWGEQPPLLVAAHSTKCDI